MIFFQFACMADNKNNKKNYLNQDILNNIDNIINKKQGFQSALIYLVQILLVNLDFLSDTNKTKSPQQITLKQTFSFFTHAHYWYLSHMGFTYQMPLVSTP